MRRFALLFLGVVGATWLQFEFFPGHTYLQGDSQIYLPVLERLDTPGYLSRDLVATHTDVTYTIYDEVTLFLHEAGHLKFRTALEGQQLFCRAAGLTGVLLLALSTGMGDLIAFLIAMFINFGAMLCGPDLFVIDHEPVPRAFAFPLILLSAGLLAQAKPLLAGLAGGIAFVYDPVIALPFWGVAGIAVAVDAQLRRLLRPSLTILAIFILLLANLAQLQPGVVESQALFGSILPPLVAVEQYRTPNAWVSLWAASDIWSCLAIYVCGVWATARIWRTLNRTLRWLLVGLPLGGILSLPVSYIGLEEFHSRFASQLQPTQALMFTVVFCAFACGVAGARAAVLRNKWEATLWLIVMIAVAVNSRILDLLHVNSATNLLELAACIALGSTVAFTMTGAGKTQWRYAGLLAPVLAAFVVPRLAGSRPADHAPMQPVLELAAWAETSTWGSSMFLFPDAGRQLYTGTFRAASRRAVWVDWSSGALVDRSAFVAVEWWDRWEHTMQGNFSPERLQDMLSLPIDYYVLKRPDQLKAVRPVFRNSEFVVYDAADLRQAVAPLTLAAHRDGN